jgi:hypothetical protein
VSDPATGVVVTVVVGCEELEAVPKSPAGILSYLCSLQESGALDPGGIDLCGLGPNDVDAFEFQ